MKKKKNTYGSCLFARQIVLGKRKEPNDDSEIERTQLVKSKTPAPATYRVLATFYCWCVAAIFECCCNKENKLALDTAKDAEQKMLLNDYVKLG